MARSTADRERGDDIVGGGVGDEVKRRVGDARADEVDAAFTEPQALADRVEGAALQLQAAAGLRIGRRAVDLDGTSQLGIQSVACDRASGPR